VFHHAVRIRRIRVWAATTASGTVATITINFTGSNWAPNEEFIDSTMNVSELAYLDVKPPKNSLAAFWRDFGNSADPLFIITCPAGTIMDLDLDTVPSDNDPSVNTLGLNSAAATLGTIYYLNLAGSASSFSPMQLQSNY